MKITDARKLEAKLKRERFERMFAQQLTVAGLAPAVPQFKFALALGRHWAADFAWPDLKLLVEVDGGIWRRGGGAHSHPSAIVRDMQKHNDAVLLGWRVLRFTTDEIKSGHAVRFVERVMVSRGTVPPVSALPPVAPRLPLRGLRARAVLAHG